MKLTYLSKNYYIIYFAKSVFTSFVLLFHPSLYPFFLSLFSYLTSKFQTLLLYLHSFSFVFSLSNLSISFFFPSSSISDLRFSSTNSFLSFHLLHSPYNSFPLSMCHIPPIHASMSLFAPYIILSLYFSNIYYPSFLTPICISQSFAILSVFISHFSLKNFQWKTWTVF